MQQQWFVLWPSCLLMGYAGNWTGSKLCIHVLPAIYDGSAKAKAVKVTSLSFCLFLAARWLSWLSIYAFGPLGYGGVSSLSSLCCLFCSYYSPYPSMVADDVWMKEKEVKKGHECTDPRQKVPLFRGQSNTGKHQWTVGACWLRMSQVSKTKQSRQQTRSISS